MPLTGELEHLPIVDVIQLIHSTRKSGTLNVYSRKGEGQLVFNNGYIVSATHSSEKLKIGQILLESQAINQEDLDKALALQERSGAARKPLLATLSEHCGLSESAAFKALESLIELTVVEMICWTRGIFTLDIDKIAISDNYRYLPKQLDPVTLDTQMVLMDALRTFDEKVHSGEIQLSDEPLLDNPLEQLATDKHLAPLVEPETEEIEVSEDLLGLADLDNLEPKKPHVFKGLDAFDPADIHRQIIDETLSGLPAEEKEKLVNYLSGISTTTLQDDGPSLAGEKSHAIIIYSGDEFLKHAVMTAGKKQGILVFVTADQHELDNLIDRALDRNLEVMLIFGRPLGGTAGFQDRTLSEIRALKMRQYPQLSVLQLTSPTDSNFALQSLSNGVRTVFPMPHISEKNDHFAGDIIHFLDTFLIYIHRYFAGRQQLQFTKVRNKLAELRQITKAPEISLQVLQFISESFARTLTLVVDKEDLIGERSIGVVTAKRQGVAPPMKFRIPIDKDSIFQQVISSGRSFCGESTDHSLVDCLYPVIGAPQERVIVLLPLLSNDRVITITYADFGRHSATPIPLEALEFFVEQASLAIENVLSRKQLNHTRKTKVTH